MLSQARTRLLSLSSRGLSTSVTARQQPHEVADLEEPSRLAAAQMGTMLDIGARSIFTSEHDMFRDQVRRWMRERLAPLQNSFEEEGQPSKEIWREMGNQVRHRLPFLGEYSLCCPWCPSKPSFVFVSRDCWECPYLPRWEGSEHPSWRRPSWPRRCPTPTARPPPWPCTPPSACKYFPYIMIMTMPTSPCPGRT